MPDIVEDLEDLGELEAIEVPVGSGRRLAVIPPAAPVPSVAKPRAFGEGMAIEDIAPLIERAETYFGPGVHGLSTEQQLVILKYLQSGNASRACASVGVGIIAHRRWLKEDENYRDIFVAADEALTDLIEETGIRSAIVDKDPKLILGLLRGRRREKYGKTAEPGETQANSWAELTRKLSSEAEDDA
ncbi:MAG: hypothetical protein HY673_14195 [Chloroflexi bacterium]|nr:hypothetical protein [Chloroflexota bacterium]